MNQEQLNQIPVFPQRQDSVSNQLADLIIVANKLGFYDAADAIKSIRKNLPKPSYGCFVEAYKRNGIWQEVEKTCVLDSGEYHNCIYADKVTRKEQCEYWKQITFKELG